MRTIRTSWRNTSTWKGWLGSLPKRHLLPDAESATLAQGPFARTGKLAWLEAVLFAADGPITSRKLAAAARLGSIAQAEEALETLRRIYRNEGSALEIVEVANGYQLATRPVLQGWLTRLFPVQELGLSNAAKETLTIIAYRQPITRADVEAIRGVATGELLRQLMEKGMIRIAGRDVSLGRPVLYGTTKNFLQAYGLSSLADLPRL